VSVGVVDSSCSEAKLTAICAGVWTMQVGGVNEESAFQSATLGLVRDELETDRRWRRCAVLVREGDGCRWGMDWKEGNNGWIAAAHLENVTAAR
jgi:hypothetical protein